VSTLRPLPADAVVIPEGATRVFEGKIFDVYQWQQKLPDDSIETFEMLKRPDTVCVFAIDNDKVIVLDEEQPNDFVRKNGMPGGRVEPTDSSVLEAAKRELREETGLEFAEWTLLQVQQPSPKIEHFVYVFVAQNKLAEHSASQDLGEKIAVKRIPYEELKQNAARNFRLIEAFNESDTLEAFLRKVPIEK
jgi:ADP-ribose pyrophosphatase YjhB (NUDIX family)